MGKPLILTGDVLTKLRRISSSSVHCIVTSPPYWGLRDYGVKGQLGLEGTPEAYIEKLVDVFRELRRVLRADGTLWLNMGDGYASSGSGGPHSGLKELAQKWDPRKKLRRSNRAQDEIVYPKKRVPRGFKTKDLIGMPWRLALALQADGWYLRTDIIWHKPNPMPESVRDRPTRSHEYIFLLTKNGRYFYDHKAVMEPVSGNSHARGKGVNPKARTSGAAGRVKQNASFSAAVAGLVDKRNRRTVWTVNTKCFRGAHFATFPPKLIEPCIAAGCPPRGLVLDPFAGAGTTGVVAVSQGKRFVGIELNPEYARMARKRLARVEK